MHKLIVLSIAVLVLCTSCLTTGKSAGIKQNYDIKQLNSQMSVMLDTIYKHDLELTKLNEIEEKILNDMGLNLDKMEQEYNKKSDIILQIRQVVFAYDIMASSISEQEQIVLKAVLYDKIKEILDENN